MNGSIDERMMGAVVALHEAGITLRDYQEDGAEWMMNLELGGESGILADDPGLGKTYQTLALCANWTEGDPPTLIVVPTSIIQQWATASRDVYGNLATYVHHGKRRHSHLWDMPRTRIVITTYGLILHDDSLQTKQWSRVVLDEIHFIKNHRGRTAKRAYSLQAPFRWGLTGTPVQNRRCETEALFRFVLGLSEDAHSTTLDLEWLLENRLLRRTKQGHLRLPDITIQNSTIDFETPEEATFYQRVQTNVRQEFQELMELGGEARDENMMMFELLLRLRQASCHPQLVLNGLARKYDITMKPWKAHSSKHLHLLRMIREHPDESALVFCQFTEEMTILQTLLVGEGLRVARLDGSISEAQRRSTLSRVAVPGAVDVFLIQIRAGGVGLNLQEFSRVYITSPDWNPCNEIQAIARSHRLGQHRAVVVTKLVLSGTQRVPVINDTEAIHTFLQGHHEKCGANSSITGLPDGILRTIVGFTKPLAPPAPIAPVSVIDTRILDIQQRKRLLMSHLLQEPDLLCNGVSARSVRLTRTDWKRLLQ